MVGREDPVGGTLYCSPPLPARCQQELRQIPRGGSVRFYPIRTVGERSSRQPVLRIHISIAQVSYLHSRDWLGKGKFAPSCMLLTGSTVFLYLCNSRLGTPGYLLRSYQIPRRISTTQSRSGSRSVP